MEADSLDASLDQLSREVEALRASRERLVLADDAEHRAIERELHRGVQQHLVALAVNLQLVSLQVDTDPEGAKAALEDMRQDVERAGGEAAALAQRIHPPLLDTGLAVALRAAVVDIGFPVAVDVRTSASLAPEVARTVLLCCLESLAYADPGARPRVTVREEHGEVVVDVLTGRIELEELGTLRDRVEALGGRLTLVSEGGGARLTASLPLSR